MTFLRNRVVRSIGLLLGFFCTAPMSARAESAVIESIRIPQDVDSIMVPVTFKGTTYSFLFDTGASHTIFDTSLRPRLGEPVGVVDAVTATGAIKLDVFNPVQATIRSLKFQTANRVGTIDLRGIRETSGYDVRGILGMDVIAKYVIRIDWGKGELAFLDSRGDDDGTAVDLTMENGCPYVRANLAGWKTDGFLIDTGCVGGTGSLRAALYQELVGAKVLANTMTGTTVSASGKVKNSAGKLKQLSLGMLSHNNVLFSEGMQNLIGISLLSRYTVTFDFPNKKMYLKKGALFSQPEFEDFSGLSLVWRNEKVIVESVRTGSPGYRTGIQPQDEIATLDGKPAPRLRLYGIRHLFCDKGRKVALTIKRNGKEYKADMTLP